MRRQGWERAVGVLVFFAVILHPSPARPEFIDHVVAAVNADVITERDLRRAIAFNEAMGGGGHDGGRLTSQTLDGLINRKLLLQEARRLKFVDVSPEDIGAEEEKVRVRFGPGQAFPGFLARAGMTKEELDRMLGERLLVERFIEKKISLLVRVGHDEAQSYFEQHPAEFKGKRFPEVQKAIAAALVEQKAGQQLDEYLAELRGKADIRMNAIGE